MNDHLKVAEPKHAELFEPYKSYLEVKKNNSDKVVFYQVGDFFEAFNDDAKTISEALDLTMTSRPINSADRVPMVGVPKHRLETYINMLTDRGLDVVVSALENGERKEYTLASQNKEDPVASKPIGRIEYLHTDGSVRESIEYTSPYQLEKDIKEDILMNRTEAQDLQKKAKKACLSEAALIRLLVRGYEPREKPDERFYDAMRQLSAIGNNINQLSAKANTLGFLDAPQLKKEAERWHKFQADIERQFLRPNECDMKWQ